MDELATPPRPRERITAADLRHLTTSALAATLWGAFAFAHIRASLSSGRVLGLGLGLFEATMAVLFFTRRSAERVTRRRWDWVVAFGGTFGSLLVRPGGPDFPWADPLGLAIQGLGLVCVALSLGVLGRSFGIVPADRGIVTSGPYRIVRHPMYASYGIAQIGYLFQSPRLWNVAVFALAWTCQIWRIRSEERFLAEDPAYQAFMVHTRWRLVPGLW